MITLRKPAVILLITTLAAIPLYVVLGSESSDWNKARMKNTATAYDVYLTYNPSGSHASEARRKAQSISSRAANAGRSCNADFPVMSYYASKGGVPASALGRAVSQASKCNFSAMLSGDERASAVEKFALTRKRLTDDKAVCDSGFIIIDIGLKVLMDASDSIQACKKGRDPWRDPTKKEVYDCSRRWRELQGSLSQDIGKNMKDDFGRVGRIGDRSFRLGFWNRYHLESRRDFLRQIGTHYRVSEAAGQAKSKERDSQIIKVIEKVAIRFGGGGKPSSSRRYR